MADWRAKSETASLSTGQVELYPLPLDHIRDEVCNGQHLHIIGEAAGSRYYCKRDSDGRPIRATEWFCTSLASHLGIPVPDFATVLNPMNGEILFGSKGQWGTASEFEVQAFLMERRSSDRAISPDPPWLSSYLAKLYIFDLFVGNPDRQPRNFLLVQASGYRRLLAYDFASADLKNLSNRTLVIAETQTVFVGRVLRELHGFDRNGAEEMIDWIAAVPASKIESILSEMPEDWLSDRDKGAICDSWVDGAVGDRLAALRRGLSDASIL